MFEPDAGELHAYAELVLDIGVRLQPGQQLAVNAEIEHAPLARALAEVGYSRGARHVDIWYFDPVAKRARVQYADESTLAEVPAWVDARYYALAEAGAALVKLSGEAHPNLLKGLPERRVGMEPSPIYPSLLKIQQQMRVAWCIVPYPTAGWAQAVYGQADPGLLWNDLRRFLRLDRRDPAAAWGEHIGRLERKARQLGAYGFERIQFHGPGTDLTVVLNADARWDISLLHGPSGYPGLLNMPTEEVYTTPDFRGTEGVVTATRPLALAGTIVEALQLTFERGEVVDVRARSGADAVRASMARDDGGRCLGEIALVDGTSPIGHTGRVFLNTLLDENATCHLAWGGGIPTVYDNFALASRDELVARGVNVSTTHVDFMVGGPDVTVTGVTANGDRVPILVQDRWCLADAIEADEATET